MLLLRTASPLRKKLYKPGQSTSRGKIIWTLFIALIFASDIRKIGYAEHY